MVGMWAFKEIIAPTGGGGKSVMPKIEPHENVFFFIITTDFVGWDVHVCSLLTLGPDQIFV